MAGSTAVIQSVAMLNDRPVAMILNYMPVNDKLRIHECYGQYL